MFTSIIRYLLSIFDFFYQKKIIKYLKGGNVKNIIDVGGHRGESVKLFLKNFSLENIYSFEPSKKNFEVLKINLNSLIKKYKFVKIHLFNYGFGDKNCNTTLNFTTESSSSTINLINKESNYYKKKIKYLMSSNHQYILNYENIELITIDYFLEMHKINHIDLLKIDTEGYEFKILQGVKKNYQNIDYIYFEHHYDNMIQKGYSFSDIDNLLKNYNFKQVFKIKMPFRKTFEYIYKNTLI